MIIENIRHIRFAKNDSSTNEGDIMEKVVLLYNFDKTRLQLIRKALAPLNTVIKTVTKKDYIQPIGYLVGADGITPIKNKNTPETFDDEMLVMYGFGSEMIDVLIVALRMGGVGKIDLKATITPSNISWDSVKLYKEIKADHIAMNR